MRADAKVICAVCDLERKTLGRNPFIITEADRCIPALQVVQLPVLTVLEVERETVAQVVADVVHRRAGKYIVAAQIQNAVLDRTGAVRISEIAARFCDRAEIVVAHAVLAGIFCVLKLIPGNGKEFLHIAFVGFGHFDHDGDRADRCAVQNDVRIGGIDAHIALDAREGDGHILRSVAGKRDGDGRRVDERKHLLFRHVVAQFALCHFAGELRFADPFDLRDFQRIADAVAVHVRVAHFCSVDRAVCVIGPVRFRDARPGDGRGRRRLIGERDRRVGLVHLREHIGRRHARIEIGLGGIVFAERFVRDGKARDGRHAVHVCGRDFTVCVVRRRAVRVHCEIIEHHVLDRAGRFINTIAIESAAN